MVEHEEHAPFAVPLQVVLHPLEHSPVQVVLHPPVQVVLQTVEHPPVQVELQLEQVAVFAVPEQVELQLEQTVDVAVPVQVVEHPPEQPDEQSDEQEAQLVEVEDPEQLEEQSDEQDAQLDDAELFVQVLRQSVTFGSLFSPQLFSTEVNELPSATKPRKGTAFVTIVLKKSLRPKEFCSFLKFLSSFIFKYFLCKHCDFQFN